MPLLPRVELLLLDVFASAPFYFSRAIEDYRYHAFRRFRSRLSARRLLLRLLE